MTDADDFVPCSACGLDIVDECFCDIEFGCGDFYCHICGDPGDLFDDEDEDDD